MFHNRADNRILIAVALILVIGAALWLIQKNATPRVELPLIVEEEGQKFVADEIIVKFKQGTSKETKKEIHKQIGGRVKDTIPQIGVEIVEIPKEQLKEKLKAYNDKPNVEYAELNYVAKILLPPQ